MSANEAFDSIVGAVDYPVYVVTAAADGKQAGCLVGFATQSSIDPARFLVCFSKRNHTFDVAQQAAVLVVHLLAADDRANAELFAGETGDDVDKFARCRWEPGPAGAPVVTDAVAWFAGRVLERIDMGDHVGQLLEPLPGEGRPPGDAAILTFHDAWRIEPGHPA